MEADGLVTHTAAGGRKTYDITDAGRAELAERAQELASLEREIGESVADLAALAEQVEEGVRGSVSDLKREIRSAKNDAAPSNPEWRQVREDWRRATDAWRATANPPESSPAADLVRKASDLAGEVRRLVSLGRATAEDVRVASTVLDSVRDQLRHILRG
jgi:DNA-binding PadR family transcriptional regulator